MYDFLVCYIRQNVFTPLHTPLENICKIVMLEYLMHRPVCHTSGKRLDLSKSQMWTTEQQVDYARTV